MEVWVQAYTGPAAQSQALVCSMKHEAFLTGAFPLTYNHPVLKQIGILAWEEDR